MYSNGIEASNSADQTDKEIYKYIENKSDFRFAIWSKELVKNRIDTLFRLIYSSLNFDYNYLPKRTFKLNDIVELKYEENDNVTREYFVYKGIDNSQEIQRVILGRNDEVNTTYKLQASTTIWRLNRSHNQNRKLLKKVRINLSSINRNIDNVVKNISEKTNIPYKYLNLFERTKILYLSTFSRSSLEEKLRGWTLKGYSFLDYFPALYYHNSKEYKKLNTEKYDRSDPERLLFIFNNLSILINYIKSSDEKDNSFFIVSDNYLHFFRQDLLQELYRLLVNPDISIKVFYVGDYKDFRRLNTENFNPFFTNDMIKPVIVCKDASKMSKMIENVKIVGSENLYLDVDKILGTILKYKELNPQFSIQLKKILFGLLSPNEFKDQQFQETVNSFRDQFLEPKLNILLKNCIYDVSDNEYKIDRDENEIVTVVNNSLTGLNDIKAITKADFIKKFVGNFKIVFQISSFSLFWI